MSNFRLNIRISNIKPFMLPLAMICGVFFHEFIDKISFLAPYLIFLMLFITYTKVSFRHFKITAMQWWLLLVQIVGSITLYFALYKWNASIAEGAFICIFCPTATAAPVITGMLGGSIATIATYSLMSNLAVALLAPAIFSFMGDNGSISFTSSFITICREVIPLLILPLVTAFILRKVAPKVNDYITSRQTISFYLWTIALFIVVGRAVSFILKQPVSTIPEEVIIAILSLIVCCIQFYVGRRIGGKYGDKIAGAQGLGQKNTVLAIWMALTYLAPIASIGPATYILWQNTINSWQLWRKRKNGNI